MKRVFNRRARQKRKVNLRKFSKIRRLFSKRMGGIIGVSVLLENRNITATDMSKTKKEIL